jgi:hypothetical protein
MPKTKVQNYLNVFTPSLSGLLLYVFLAGAAMILVQFPYIQQYLQLPQDLHLTRTIAAWANHVLISTIGETRTQTLVVGSFWALVGLAVYIFLHGLAQIFTELDDDIEARHYIWPKGSDRDRQLHRLLEQAIFRGAAFIALILFVFLPLAAVLRGPVLVGFLGPDHMLQNIVWFILSVLCWHAVVVLLRLVSLRARLFG